MYRALKHVAWRVLAVILGLAFAGLVVAAFGKSPVSFYSALLAGAFGSSRGLVATLAKTTPLVLAGLAVAVPLKAGLFNIGAEGQMYAGAIASLIVALIMGSLPGAVVLPLVLLAGTAAGMAWGALAGFLKSRFSVHEVIATIMLNFVAFYIVAWLVNTGPLADPSGVGRSPEVPLSARIPVIFRSGAAELSAALFIALAAALFAWWLVSKSATGFKMRAAGANPIAADRAEIDVPAMTRRAMAVGGAFAGLAGALELTAVQYSVSAGFSPGYGFDGIAVALVAGAAAPAVPLAAFLFAALRAAGAHIQLAAGLSQQMIYVLEGTIIIAAAIPSLPPALRWIIRRRRPVAADPTEGGDV